MVVSRSYFSAKVDFRGFESAFLIVDTKAQQAPEELDLHQRSNLQIPLLQQEQHQVPLPLFSDFDKHRNF
jgi:hypothetical protein